MDQLTFALRESAAPAPAVEAAIARHKTGVDTKTAWNGPRARAGASSAPVLRHMHAVFRGGEADVKANYVLPHHAPRAGSAANIAGVNNALARLPQTKGLSEADRRGAERHLRGHRKDAGLEEAMTAPEIDAAMDAIGKGLRLTEAERTELRTQVDAQEAAAGGELREALSGSWEDIEDLIRSELRAVHGDEFRWTEGTFSDRVVYIVEAGGERRFLERSWSMSDEGDVTLGDPREVKLVTSIEPASESSGARAPAGAGEAPGSGPEHDATTREAGDLNLAEFIPLRERALRGDGTMQIRVIQPGWGNSGYYSPELLQRDGPAVFGEGTKMYWDHPTRTEEKDRPERSLRDLAAVLTSKSNYLQEGPDGPGLYAFAKAVPAYKESIESLAPHIGVSIRAFGQGKHGEAEGRSGRIIEKIVGGGHSVDFVTEPGAGGKVLELFEAARPAEREDDMAELTEVTRERDEARTQLLEAARQRDEATARAERAEGALIVREARDVIAEALVKTRLPQVVRERLLERLSQDPPLVADGDSKGQLDRDKLGEAVKAAIAEEVAYLEKATGSGKVRGMGSVVEGAGGAPEHLSEADAKKLDEELEAEFLRMGMSEAGAKHAAAGRF